MHVGYRLYREVRDFAPATWDTGMLVTALMIADAANDKTRIAIITQPLLCARTRLGITGFRSALHRLSKDGYEFRIARGKDRNGRPVYTGRGYEVDYQVPDMTAIGMASMTAAGDGQPVDKPP